MKMVALKNIIKHKMTLDFQRNSTESGRKIAPRQFPFFITCHARNDVQIIELHE